MFQGAKVPQSKSVTQRAKVPGNELATVHLELSLQEANWPSSEKARYCGLYVVSAYSVADA